MTTTAPERDGSLSLGGAAVVVTGGASGIGYAVSRLFAANGGRVAILDLNGEGAHQRAGELGETCIGLQCDVTDPDSVMAAVAEVVTALGRIEVLVNNAGVVSLAPAEDLSVTAWDATIAVNLRGMFLMSQAAGKHMLGAGRGKIINLASQAATVALEGHAAYCASKAGVLGLTRVLAYEWAPRGVTVNAISPTVVMTDLGRRAWAGEKGEAMKVLIPTRRFAEPEEVAAVALFLASGMSDMINGADILVDGGYTIW